VAVEFSAKLTDDNEITPQTDYVIVRVGTRCDWNPRFELSASLCTVDVTWFPFDEQICDLIFESWLLRNDELAITIDRSRDILKYYVSSDEWDLLCACN